ncbi:HAD family hydrolase [Streptomyces armeniacus]|uniref:HAD family hydrolase n=1 Tax=Streptomyces armeniacus TaxID=83291 RepID=A0A345XTE0_9ACTN|nr:HAD-IA family hydrolase [Streptomyces armeniacus]AXK34906.1 HAD family hydrolase [Streptomyces armeniacus]
MPSHSRLAAGLAAPLRAVRAVVFDTDGVLVDSARLHAAAWKDAFDPCLAEAGQRPFDAREEYRRWVDGKSRLDGAAALLAARGLALPEGGADDPPGTGSVRAVAARKEEAFTRRLGAAPVPVWPGTPRLLRALHAVRTPCAAVSASRHAPELLARAGLRELFAVVVDGNEAARLGLPGKPDPALFLEAARRLGAQPAESAVVEDALAGVEAGRRGGFRTVVGVDRAASADSAADLRAYGADVVVGDLAELLAENAGHAEHEEQAEHPEHAERAEQSGQTDTTDRKE